MERQRCSERGQSAPWSANEAPSSIGVEERRDHECRCRKGTSEFVRNHSPTKLSASPPNGSEATGSAPTANGGRETGPEVRWLSETLQTIDEFGLASLELVAWELSLEEAEL